MDVRSPFGPVWLMFLSWRVGWSASDSRDFVRQFYSGGLGCSPPPITPGTAGEFPISAVWVWACIDRLPRPIGVRALVSALPIQRIRTYRAGGHASTMRRLIGCASCRATTSGASFWYASPATHVGYELIAAGMLILAGNGSGLPFDYDELERWTRVGYERGTRSRKGER
jgi:hypothetical protein